MKITIIGAGNIGGAIARGLAKGHMFKASDITCTAQSDTTLEKIRNTNPDFVLSLDNVEAVKGADIIVIAVKPWRVEEIIDQIKGILDYDKQIIVSVAAGITFDLLNTYLTKNTGFDDCLSFITEGAIPYAAADPGRVLPSCIIGSAIALAMIIGFSLLG